MASFGPQKPFQLKKSPNKRFNGMEEIHVEEMVRDCVKLSLERFHFSDDTEMEFPSAFNSTERAFIHRMARSLGYSSKSTGKGSLRFVTIRKKNDSDKPVSPVPLPLSHNSMSIISSLLQNFRKSSDSDGRCNRYRVIGSLDNGIPLVPPKRSPTELDTFRCSLPVHKRQDEILQLIRDNRVLMVLGETGSGKSTQIPQFVLDECSRNGEPCRIFCIQPRPLTALAVAERIAAERGESLGQTVGYHVRLENRVSPKTCLIICTPGVLLGTLMTGDTTLTKVTHVIMDEAHERDGLSDFLLTKMKDVLQKIPKLKLILSGAALDASLFLRYFSNCAVIRLIQERQFEVKELFLEDVLKLTGFNRTATQKNKQSKNQKHLAEWCEAAGERSTGEKLSSPEPAAQSLLQDREDGLSQQTGRSEQVETQLQRAMDSCIARILLDEEEEAFHIIYSLILNSNIDVNYRHSQTGSTPLMVAAGRGFISQVIRLLNMGADINVKDISGWKAIHFANHFKQEDAADIIRFFTPEDDDVGVDMSSLVLDGETELSAVEQDLLRLYHHSFDDKQVDLDLIMDLLHHICSNAAEGAVLIFLPEYEEIAPLRDRILCEDERFIAHPDRYQVFTLHSNMLRCDQSRVIKTAPPGIRKIILSTNIAETSIPINDVVYVIDSGKVKEKSFDTLSCVSTLKTVWISKASALQRKERAGAYRPGICFRLFSRLQFSKMLEFQVPQLPRMQLRGLCLQTKLLAPPSCSVAEFLSQAPQPPPADAIKNTVDLLKRIDAMDEFENLTDLGYLLADLALEPQLGKIVLCGVVLKCLDPVLTIACMLAYGDPFILPVQSSQKEAASQCRQRFAENSLSDHMALLRVFQAWQKACHKGQQRSFCEKNFLSQASMEMILGMRTQLLGQLRAIGLVRVRGYGDIRDVNQNSENWAVVKASLAAGLFPNVVYMCQRGSLALQFNEKRLIYQPTSVLSSTYNEVSGAGQPSKTYPTKWLIYDEMIRGNRVASVRGCSLVTSITVAIFGGSYRLPDSALWQPAGLRDTYGPLDGFSDSDSEELAEITIAERMAFQLDGEAAGLVFGLRKKWQNLFSRKIRYPSRPNDKQDEAVVHALVSVLSAEEQNVGLRQPTGVGQRPRLMTFEDVTLTLKNSKSAPQPPPKNSPDRSTMTAASGCPTLKLHIRDESQTFDPSWFSSSSTDFSYFSEQLPRPPSFLMGFTPTRYFIMKSSNMENITVSKQRGIWFATPSNETKLSYAFVNSNTVFLIFTVQGSEHFQGYARMVSAVSNVSSQDCGLVGSGRVLSVDWIHRENVPFHCTRDIRNLWNDNLRVESSRDGQELETNAGRQLLSLWE